MHGRSWDRYESFLSRFSFFTAFREGKTGRDEFAAEMTSNKEKIIGAEVNEYNFYRLLRGVSGNREAEGMIEAFAADGGFAEEKSRINFCGMYGGCEAFAAKIKPVYESGGFITEIFPEDELCMYAASQIINPASVFVAGSYFGYWAVWAMPAVLRNGGQCILSDVNPDVTAVAKKNMESLGFGSCARCIAADAEEMLLSCGEPIDLLALDAAGSHADPRTTHRGKALYGPLLAAARHRLRKGSHVIVHNAERGSGDMSSFFELIDEIASVKTELVSYNCLGLYKI
ncbi:MAG: class I SAM-dependent methyltransferase [Defluviitaleaceae bacterium]|nr:class I SAM-dependent methyltransferase [Defluviitaleaceae bacterium]